MGSISGSPCSSEKELPSDTPREHHMATDGPLASP